MAKRKTPKVQDLRPDSITKEELQKLQNVVKIINEAQMQIGMLESQKHAMLHKLGNLNEVIEETKKELEAYAREHGVELDRRLSRKKLLDEVFSLIKR